MEMISLLAVTCTTVHCVMPHKYPPMQDVFTRDAFIAKALNFMEQF